MKFLKLLGKIVLWIIAVYILTIINFFIMIKIFNPDPPAHVIPILCLAILEAVLIYRLFKNKAAVQMEMTEKKRSRGVTIFACLHIMSVVISIPLIFSFKSRLLEFQAAHFVLPSSYLYVTQSSNIIKTIAYLIAGIGLLKLLNWARLLSIVIAIVGFLYSVLFYFVYTKPYIIPNAIQEGRPVFPFFIFYTIGFLFVIGTIYFFMHPKVKEQFE